MTRKRKTGDERLSAAATTVVSHFDHLERQREVEQRCVEHFNTGRKTVNWTPRGQSVLIKSLDGFKGFDWL